MAAAKRKKTRKKSEAGWSWRLAGIALCAFFALGVITGLSRSGRSLALRVEALLNLLPGHGRSALIAPGFVPNPAVAHGEGDGAIALVERGDGFYLLSSGGELRGPVSPAGAGDLPILSGPGASDARPPRLLEFAGMLVRAEVNLSERISEMRVDGADAATLFPERSRIGIRVNPNDITAEIARARQVLQLWRGHRDLIATIDATTPGLVVVRPRPGALEAARRGGGRVRAVAMAASARERRSPEVTASR